MREEIQILHWPGVTVPEISTWDVDFTRLYNQRKE